MRRRRGRERPLHGRRRRRPPAPRGRRPQRRPAAPRPGATRAAPPRARPARPPAPRGPGRHPRARPRGLMSAPLLRAGADHHDRIRERGDDPVSRREVAREPARAVRLLGHERAARGEDLLEQHAMLRRVAAIDPGPEHRDRCGRRRPAHRDGRRRPPRGRRRTRSRRPRERGRSASSRARAEPYSSVERAPTIATRRSPSPSVPRTRSSDRTVGETRQARGIEAVTRPDRARRLHEAGPYTRGVPQRQARPPTAHAWTVHRTGAANRRRADDLGSAGLAAREARDRPERRAWSARVGR